MPGRRLLARPATLDNPYLDLVYDQLRARGWEVAELTPKEMLTLRAEVVHIHWPDLVLADRRPVLRLMKAAAFVAGLWVVRVRGRVVVWTVHNPFLRAELATWWGERFLSLVARASTGLILMSRDHVGAHRTSREKPAAVIAHPHYRLVYGRPRESAEAKRRLRVDPGSRVAGFFGQVRPYKNVESLARAFAGLDDDSARLVVAGHFHGACRGLRDELSDDPRTVVLDRHVPDDEVAWILAAMDLVVLPYEQLGNSAVALLALSYEVPVLAPSDVESIEELRSAVGPGWVRLFEGELTPEALAGALESPRPVPTPDLSGYEPELVGELTHSFLCSLADRGGSPP